MSEEAAILVVDDEPKICSFIEVLLRREGYRVDSALSADQAIEKVKQTEYQLVITDLKMPGMDGFQLVKQLREINYDLPLDPEEAMTNVRTGQEVQLGV